MAWFASKSKKERKNLALRDLTWALYTRKALKA